jgi:hypothetical protein
MHQQYTQRLFVTPGELCIGLGFHAQLVRKTYARNRKHLKLNKEESLECRRWK